MNMKVFEDTRKDNNNINSSDTSEQASKDASEPKQITLSATFKRAALLPSNSPRYSSLLRTTMNFIFQTLQPLSIVDEPSFCNFSQVIFKHLRYHMITMQLC